MRSRALTVTLVTAVSLSLFSAPHASPAEIGPRDSNGECSITYTDAEAARVVKDANAMLDIVEGYHDHALDAVYPGTVQLMASVRESAVYEQVVASVLTGTPANPDRTLYTHEENLDRVVAQFGSEAAALGMPASALRSLVAWASLIDWSRTEIALPEQAESIEAFPDWKEGFFETTTEEFSRLYPELTASQTARAVDAYNEQVRRAASVYQGQTDATDNAREACAAGGNATVPFPTDSDSDSGSAAVSSDDGADNGLLAGVVVAIVAVLAAVGGVFAFAPQVGIELPNIPGLPL